MTWILQTEFLSKSYSDGAAVRALEDISISISTGEFIAISGPSGSGKSTLLNLIGTLDIPSSGRVIINGVDINTLKGDALADFRRENIGFVFQLFNLIPTLNAVENAILPLLPYQRGLNFSLEKRARDLLHSMGLKDRLYHLPGQLSGGEQQRVAITRALINSPQLILADEPTGNLDTKTSQEIVQLLHRLNREQGLTVILVTHDDKVASQADRVIHIKDGRLQKEVI